MNKISREQLRNDIPLSIAREAHMGTSFSPEKRAEQEQIEYAEVLAGDFDDLNKYADTEEKSALLEVEFARYRGGYLSHYLALLSSKSRCLSAMIAGPSKFPTRRNEKANQAADKKYQALKDFRERALKSIKKKLCPELAPIMSGDSDAIERLREKIRKAEEKQTRMKQANKIIQSKPKNESTPKKIADLEAIGLRGSWLFEKDYAGRCGFPSYSLTNNNANIRRMKQRLEKITRDQSTPDKSFEGTEGRSVEDCPAESRVRIFFPGKPDVPTRTDLKQHGFRWSPKIGCWQAHRNQYSLDYAHKIAGVTK